eukprot:TRINITY_DN6180_c0_g1_i1.p1 TRINITY_DN6180_c0_g1~~TRINITY_DN6180_c0_g1_i1.p1  ORF type:complete len:217 (-),score=77.96 TRINITY_DN6180_c0_g1_i1:125-775(-)
MPSIKLTYFNLRGRGELPRLLLAYARVPYEDERIALPWDDPKPWAELKPSTPFGQLPVMLWDGEEIAQCLGVPGSGQGVWTGREKHLEAAQVDEIVYALQDALAFGWEAMFDGWGMAKEKTMNEKYCNEIVPAILSQIEARLKKRGGQFLVGNMFSLADLQTFFFCSEQSLTWGIAVDVKKYPGVAGLVRRVGEIPNIKQWVQDRPATTGPDGGSL